MITTSSLPAGTVGVAYSQALGASGGTPPYTWSVASGSLPAGLSLAAGGTISGTPGTAGSSSFTVRVTDSASAIYDGCAVADDQPAGVGDYDVVAAGRHGRRGVFASARRFRRDAAVHVVGGERIAAGGVESRGGRDDLGYAWHCRIEQLHGAGDGQRVGVRVRLRCR